MGQLVLSDLDDGLLASLKDRAKRHGRTVEEETCQILAGALQPSRKAAALAQLDALREQTAGTVQTPSDLLLREIRDGR